MSNKVLESLKKLLPEDSLNEVSSVVEELLSESKKELETEFDQKLQEAYQELSTELQNAEKVAYQGYEEAYAVIQDLRHRLQLQKEEFEKTLDEGYEEAYQMLQAEKAKNNSLEVDIYEEYDKKLSEMKDYVVEKIDQFLQYKGSEIYEQAKRDLLNDPRYAEHKVALDKIIDITSNYLSDEERTLATSSKLEEARKQSEELKAQMKMMEARSIRLSQENTKLNEALRQQTELINESRQTEKKERTQKSKNVSGRGDAAAGEETVVIAENNNGATNQKTEDTSVLVEGMNLETLNTLAGTLKKKQ
jgi:hypothetical protein